MNTPDFAPTDSGNARAVIEEHFPGLWPAVDAALSTAATILLEDNANPVALIFMDGPSTSKTTVADMLVGHPMTYRSDHFTPAAFVSHAANVEASKLGKVDLLPKIRHKLFITPELAPIFRGKEDDLTKSFSIITRVLDGRGLTSDKGTHGQRGHVGDYMFAWLGCTTPFSRKVWDVMGQLGSRLIFYRTSEKSKEVSVSDLLEDSAGLAYIKRLALCRESVQAFLTQLLAPGARGVTWPAVDPELVRKWIAQLAVAVAMTRSTPGSSTMNGDYIEAQRELPLRIHAILTNFARGHALVHGRTQLAEADLPVVAKVAFDSMPAGIGPVFAARVRKGSRLTTADVKAALGIVADDPARRVMQDMNWRGVMVLESEGPPPKPAYLDFLSGPKWTWTTDPALKSWLMGGIATPSKVEV